MLLSKEEIDEMGQLGKLYYKNNLSMEASVDKLEQIFKKIASK